MRTPAQTEELIQVVSATIRQFPNMRLTQILGNLLLHTDLYYVPDKGLITALKTYMRDHK